MKNLKEIEGNRRKCASANRTMSGMSHVTTRERCVTCHNTSALIVRRNSSSCIQVYMRHFTGKSKDFGAGTGRVVFDA